MHTVVNPLAPYTGQHPLGVDIAGLTAATQTALTCLQNAVAAAGGSLAVTSAFRPQAYQNHLREVWDKRQQLLGWTEAECATIKTAIDQDFALHGLAFQPALVSNHSAGNAFDATFTLPAGQNIDTIAAGCNLSRPVAGDLVHFVR